MFRLQMLDVLSSSVDGCLSIAFTPNSKCVGASSEAMSDMTRFSAVFATEHLRIHPAAIGLTPPSFFSNYFKTRTREKRTLYREGCPTLQN